MAETSNGGLEVEYGITLNKLVKQLASAEARMAKTAKRAEVGFANSNSKITRGFNEANNAANNFSKFGMRNASMQLSQVAQQGAVTGNYLQALAIQLPDLALGFGTVGIMAGALAPILFNVAKGYFDGLGKAVKLSDATKTLGESLESYRGYAVLAATDTATLKDKFGEFADQIKGFSEYMAGVSLGQSMDDLKATVTPLQDGLSGALDLVNQMKEAQLALIKIEGQAAQGFATSEQILMSREALDAISSAADDAAGDLGLTTDQIFSLHEAIQELSTASGMDEMRDSASKAFRLITAMYPAGEKLPAPLREAAGELEKMAKKAVGTKTEIENAGTAGKLLSETDMSAGIRDAIANARTLVTVLTAAQAAAQRQAEAKGDRNSLQSQYAMYGAGHDAMVSSQTEASYAPDGGWGNKFKAPSSSKSSSGKSDAQKYQNDLMREGIRLTESLRTAQEKYNDEAERAKELLDSGAISTETFTRRMAELADELNGDSFKKIEDSLKSLSDDLANAIVNGDSLGDVLEASFKQAAAAYISSGLQNAFMGIFGGSSGGGLGGFISSILGVSNGGYASGGYTGDGGKYDPAGVVHRGEYVFNQKAVKAAGGPSALEGLHRKLNSGYATGGYVGSGASAGGTSKVSVEIYVNDDGTLGAIARQYGAEGGAAVAVQTVNKNNRKIAEQQRRPT